jgi:hypothetical protein
MLVQVSIRPGNMDGRSRHFTPKTYKYTSNDVLDDVNTLNHSEIRHFEGLDKGQGQIGEA